MSGYLERRAGSVSNLGSPDSIKKFVRTARRYRTIQIRTGRHLLTAEHPFPPDLRDALALPFADRWPAAETY